MYKYSKTILLALVFSLLAGVCALPYGRAIAPNCLLPTPVTAQTSAPEARKFDEFGDVQLSDLAARLDNFAIELLQNPQNRGFLIVYRSRRDLPGLSSRLVNWMKNYLVHTRGFSEETIVAVDGGVAGAVAQELWIVPPGTAPKPRADAYATQLEDTAAARKFDEGPYYTRSDQLESYTWNVSNSLEGFAEALRKEPNAFGYLIGYSGYRTDEWGEVDRKGRNRIHRRVVLDPAGTAAKELRTIRAALGRDYRIPGFRLKLVNGGYRKWRSVELWIVPRDQHAPIPTPNAFPKRRR